MVAVDLCKSTPLALAGHALAALFFVAVAQQWCKRCRV